MSLSEFIVDNLEPILDEWERFAADIPAAQGLDTRGLRDDARGILEVIAQDLLSSQSDEQEGAKSRGRGPRSLRATFASLHGVARVAEGFNVSETMSEYRALRASVLRLWRAPPGADSQAMDELVRFNEAVDQALTESLEGFTALKDRQSRLFDALLSSSPDLNYILEENGRLIYANRAMTGLFGIKRDELHTTNLYSLCGRAAPDFEQHVHHVAAANTTYRGELALDRRPGEDLTFEYLLVPVLDPQGHCEAVAGTARDITERKAAEDRARYNANYDQLTDLANRSLFRERLELEMRHTNRTGLPLALLFIDLDGFKGVNDRLGHAAGDQLLRQVAQRISHLVRETDTVARLGGDEFTVILTDVTQLPSVETLAGRVVAELARPFALSAAQVCISSSVGIAAYPGDADSPEDLVRNADAAMYAAKNAGRNGFRFFAKLHGPPHKGAWKAPGAGQGEPSGPRPAAD